MHEWFSRTYQTYWWHYLYFEAPKPMTAWYLLPLAGLAVGVAGVARAMWLVRDRLLDPGDARLRQMLLLLAAAVAVVLPFLSVDLVRRADGLQFFASGGRYLIPAFPGVAVLFVAGLAAMFRGRVLTIALAVSAGLMAVLSFRVYDFEWLNRYFGHVDRGELLERLAFDRPEFVTPTSIGLCAVLCVATLIAFAFAFLETDRGLADPPRR